MTSKRIWFGDTPEADLDKAMDLISRSFLWSDTIQGNEYWIDVYANLRDLLVEAKAQSEGE